MLDTNLTIVVERILFFQNLSESGKFHIIFFSMYYQMEETGEYTMNKVTIDSLSSDTRIHILSALRERKKTNAELAKELSLTPPTIHHHLEILKTADLVVAIANDHKWVYYDLTPFGRALLVPGKKIRVSVILSSVLTFITAVAVLYTYVTVPSLDIRPWVPANGGPFFWLLIIAIMAILAQVGVILYMIYPVRLRAA